MEPHAMNEAKDAGSGEGHGDPAGFGSPRGGAEEGVAATVSCRADTKFAYDITIGKGLGQRIPQLVRESAPSARLFVVISDVKVWETYGASFARSFAEEDMPLIFRTIPEGEVSKSRKLKELVEDWMLEKGCHRDICVVALGGGVVGDVSGFIASTFMRGVPFVQVPTTLLAMVDASIGGKTGVNVPGGKNLIGAFHQPSRVIVDIEFLTTLPQREFLCGMAEIIKIAVTTDAEFFRMLTNKATQIQQRKQRVLLKVIARAVELKAKVVSTDAKERGLRAVLNFGHTVGHAIEAVGSPEWQHGECVAAGMIAETRISRALGFCFSSTLAMLYKCLRLYGLPTEIPFPGTKDLESYSDATSAPSADRIAAMLGASAQSLPTVTRPAVLQNAYLTSIEEYMRKDKKNATANIGEVGSTASVVLLQGIGQILSPPYSHEVPIALIRRVIAPNMAISPLLSPPSSDMDIPSPAQEPAIGCWRDSEGRVHVRVPGSKSISNRALVLAALSDGVTRLKGMLISDDTLVMVEALKAMGVRIEFNRDTVEVHGVNGSLQPPSLLKLREAASPTRTGAPAESKEAGHDQGTNFGLTSKGLPVQLSVANSGTSARFLTALCSLLPRSSPKKTTKAGRARDEVPESPSNLHIDSMAAHRSLEVMEDTGSPTPSEPQTTTAPSSGHAGIILTGSPRMQERPIAPLVKALRAQGADISFYGIEGCLPLFIGGGGLEGGRVRIEGKISSQFVSAILMIAPYARAPVDLLLAEEMPTSLPFIRMTVQVMRAFGADVREIAPNHYKINNQPYRSPGTYEVERDATSASYFAGLAAITRSDVVIEGIGSDSLQGDAKFAEHLRAMGCEVTQSPTQTLVSGPRESLLKRVNVDMGDQTDAFLTLAVLAAVADGDTEIHGIANQRVKECNRIAAMVKELNRVGVSAKELEDGIYIEGNSSLLSRQPPSVPTIIHCYNDHRIAMAFATLATAAQGLAIDDPLCVNKTFSEFWDCLEGASRAGMPFDIRGEQYSPESAAVPVTPQDQMTADDTSVLTPTGEQAESEVTEERQVMISSARDIESLRSQLKSGFAHFPAACIQNQTLTGRFVHDSSIILVGMRGCGKSFLGKQTAQALGWRWVDIDEELESAENVSCAEIVQRQGWETFRQLELEHLRRVLMGFSQRTVISCGGGVVETLEARQLLRGHWPVIHIKRDIVDIQFDLEGRGSGGGGRIPMDTRRPQYAGGEPLESAWARRRPMYEEVASHLFFIRRGDHAWMAIAADFAHFVRRLGANMYWHPEQAGEPSALEYFAFSDQLIACIRRALPRTPIIFTVRSALEGGQFGATESQYFSLLRLAVRLGCEFIDVEGSWNPETTTEFLLHKGSTRIIGSRHFSLHEAVSQGQPLGSIFVSASLRGGADIVKVAANVRNAEEVHALRSTAAQFEVALREEFEERFAAQPIAVITLATSNAGRISRLQNSVMTPVTHPKLTSAAAGQLSAADLMRLRVELGIQPRRKFFLFGSPIAQSPSPIMHNTAFRSLLLPYTYSLYETQRVQDVLDALRNEDAGGASITIPLKHSLLPHLDEVSEAARTIGAVNTVCVMEGGSLYGDNTDWLGILLPIHAALQRQTSGTAREAKEEDDTEGSGMAESSRPAALVIGGGGTAMAACYAVSQLGMDIWIYNRTEEKAKAIAERFGGNVLPSWTNIALLPPLRVIISTVPAQARMEVPEPLLDTRPVVLDANYRPRTTLLLAQAKSHGCPIVEGIEMLIAQGLAQSTLWTGRVPPGRRVAETVLHHYSLSSVANDMSALRQPTPEPSGERTHSQSLEMTLESIDGQLRKLLHARVDLASRLVKENPDALRMRMELHRKQREASRLVERMKGPMSVDVMTQLLEEIDSVTLRSTQRTVESTTYLGPPGNFCHEAALKFFPRNVQLKDKESVSEVFRSLIRGKTTYGVVPIEHSTEGSVRDTLSLLLEHCDAVEVIGEVSVPVSYSLLTPSGVSLYDIHRVYLTHRAATLCSEWLSTSWRKLERVFVASESEGAEAAAMQEDSGSAVIAPAIAGEPYGLVPLERAIENNLPGSQGQSAGGSTRYVVLGRRAEGRSEPSDADKTSIIFALRDKPGALHDALGCFGRCDVNMSRIESLKLSESQALRTRIASSHSGPGVYGYMFFVDIEGGSSKSAMAAALKELRSHCAFLTVLGTYKSDAF